MDREYAHSPAERINIVSLHLHVNKSVQAGDQKQTHHHHDPVTESF